MTESQEENLLWLRTSRNLSHYIQTEYETSLVSARKPLLCIEQLDPVLIVYFVTSAPRNRKNRRIIRETWGKNLRPKPIFFLGVTDDYLDMELAVNEAKLYQDVVIENFIDSYNNLTLKTGFMLKHFMELCPNARFLMKTDDDMFVNTKLINELLTDESSLFGKVITGSKPFRTPISKWYTPKWLYKNDYYPTYLSGTGYIIPGQAVKAIYVKSLLIPMIQLEDVFFTGMIAFDSLEFNFKHDNRFREDKPFFENVCLYEELITAHRLHPSLLQNIWEEMQRNDKNCDSLFNVVVKMFFNFKY